MRRILRRITKTAPDQLGDTSTVDGLSVVEALMRKRLHAVLV